LADSPIPGGTFQDRTTARQVSDGRGGRVAQDADVHRIKPERRSNGVSGSSPAHAVASMKTMSMPAFQVVKQ
jgi:hypothetical protein